MLFRMARRKISKVGIAGIFCSATAGSAQTSVHMPSDMYIIIAMISDMMANPQNARFDECITLYRIFVVPIPCGAPCAFCKGGCRCISARPPMQPLHGVASA